MQSDQAKQGTDLLDAQSLAHTCVEVDGETFCRCQLRRQCGRAVTVQLHYTTVMLGLINVHLDLLLNVVISSRPSVFDVSVC